MLGARLDGKHQSKLWPEAVYTTTKLDNSVPYTMSKKSLDVQWYGEHPCLLNQFVPCGQIGYVTLRNKRSKLTKKSIKSACMGYTNNNSGEVFLIHNVTWAEWHVMQEIPESLKMLTKDLMVDVTDD